MSNVHRNITIQEDTALTKIIQKCVSAQCHPQHTAAYKKGSNTHNILTWNHMPQREVLWFELKFRRYCDFLRNTLLNKMWSPLIELTGLSHCYCWIEIIPQTRPPSARAASWVGKGSFAEKANANQLISPSRWKGPLRISNSQPFRFCPGVSRILYSVVLHDECCSDLGGYNVA